MVGESVSAFSRTGIHVGLVNHHVKKYRGVAMIRQLEHLNVLRARPAGDLCLALASHEQRSNFGRATFLASEKLIQFPHRPDASVISEAIPLFYVGRTQKGFWVARELEGRSGGLFLFQRSALRFVKSKSQRAGCATMFLAEPLELDIENQGSRLVAQLATALDIIARRAPGLTTFVGMVVAEWRKLVTQVSRAVAGERRNREAIEKELFRGQYTLSSKNDDDLPIVP